MGTHCFCIVDGVGGSGNKRADLFSVVFLDFPFGHCQSGFETARRWPASCGAIPGTEKRTCIFFSVASLGTDDPTPGAQRACA